MQTIQDDGATCGCGAAPSRRVTCDECGVSAVLAECGCMAQPRPIAAGLPSGRDMHRTYCGPCAESRTSVQVGEMLDPIAARLADANRVESAWFLRGVGAALDQRDYHDGAREAGKYRADYRRGFNAALGAGS